MLQNDWYCFKKRRRDVWKKITSYMIIGAATGVADTRNAKYYEQTPKLKRKK